MRKIFCLILLVTVMVKSYSQNSFIVLSGTTLKYSGGTYLVLSDINFINNSSFVQAVGDGSVKFTGNTDVSISGTGTTTIDHLVLEKGTGSKLSLLSAVGIAEEINFSGGLLDLGNTGIDLGSTAVLNNESETSRAISTGTGYVQFAASLNAPNSANPGNLGAIITSGANLGMTTVRRSFLSATNSYGNGSSILRQYIITPTNNTGLNATLRINYLDAELNGLLEGSLSEWKSVDGVHWTDKGFSSRNTTSNYVEQTGLSDFSTWTLSNPGNALPLRDILLQGTHYSNENLLQWQTMDELNMVRFSVERSSNGTDFTAIGTVAAAGTGNNRYSFTDAHPDGASFYYRIKTEDWDGNAGYSREILLHGVISNSTISVYPNPAGTDLVLQMTDNSLLNTFVKLYDASGRFVKELRINNLQQHIDLHNLPNGLVWLKLSNGKILTVVKE